MKFYEICIRRPVFTIVLAIVLVVLGFLGLRELGVREYPAVESPVISITGNYTGANAEVIEAQVTEIIEEAVNTVAGIKTMTSSSRDGASRIRIEFELGTDLESAANDVRDQLSRAVRLLPRDMDPPSLTKADADGGSVLTFVLRSKEHDLMALTEIAERVKDQLQTVPEVGAVDILGEKRYSIKIWLDPERLAAHGLTAPDVAAALRRESVELPGGRIENSTSELNVQTLARLSTPAEFDRLAIVTEGDRTVRLHEIARTELLPLNERISFTVRGQPMLGLAVRPQPGANQIAIVDEAMRRLEEVKRALPSGVTLEVASDNTRFVRVAIMELGETILIALGLVVSVIFLFLGSWRTTLVPAVVIPISLIATFFIMRAAGFSINVLTLLGLVLAVGLVVDDAIVVVENIHRRRELGLPPIEAGIEGTKEVFLAVIATTLAVVAVFSPILFLGGLTGRLFREFGFVIGGSVAISAFVALSLTPMMAARFASGHEQPPRWWKHVDRWIEGMRAAYRGSLTSFLGWRWAGVGVLVGATGLTVAAYRVLPQELAPLEDRNRLTLSATGPEGVSYDYMLELMSGLEKKVNEEVPEATLITCQVPASGARSGTGVANTGLIELILKPKGERKATQAEIAARLTRLVKTIAGARFNISQEPSIGERRSGNSVQYVLRAGTIPELKAALPRFMEAAGEVREFSTVDVDLKFTRPELRVALDRERLQNLGVSASDVASTLQAALSGQRVAYFNRSGRQYEILQQLSSEYRDDASNLGRLSVRTDTGKLVTLDNLVDVNETVAPPQRFRFNRQAAATVSARLGQGVTLAEGVNALDRVAEETLPAGVTTALTGSAAEFAESQRGLAFGFAMALVFVYLVLAAQFESWRAPFVIMLTVPLALLGALGALWYFRQSLNIFSQIGIIMLVGLITKNGILLVEFTLQRLAAGVAPREAVIESADTRLRPILMTSVATVLGVLPIALALGAGAESRVSMGIAVIGGLVLGSALTLYVIPAVFLMVCGKSKQQVVAVHSTELIEQSLLATDAHG